MRILYDSKNIKFKKPFGCLKEGEKCTVHILIPSSCEAYDVKIFFINDHTGKEMVFSMEKTKNDEIYDEFESVFSIDEAGLYFYKFFIKDRCGSYFLFKSGFKDTNISGGNMWQVSCINEDMKVPEFFWGKVMYQIFPDRFNKEGECDLSEKLTPFTVHKSTKEMPVFSKNENGKILNNDFFGGNFKGIEKKLPYLKDMGISVIYLNPIFKAFSNHRYDTCDYKKPDPMLGTETDFKNLCQKAHEMGIKIILDGVFSHTGSDSLYFDKNKRFGHGAYSNPESPYKSWYKFSSYPDKYESWWGIDTLPEVNELCESYMDYIIYSQNSVIKKWLNLGCDGFRLDVADELPDEFIYALRKETKKIKPESLIIGEVWEDASNKISYSKRRKYFIASELDSVMNYCFKNAIIDFVTEKISGEEFKYQILTVCENYPSECVNSLMNSLSTHDTERILTSLSGVKRPENDFDAANFTLKGDILYKAMQRLAIAVFLQFTLPGMPCIYYGDEIGMQSYGDPFCRAYYDSSSKNDAVHMLYKEMCRIKNKYLPLQRGNTEFEKTDGVLIFTRTYKGEKLKAIINMSDFPLKTDETKIISQHSVTLISGSYYINKGGFVLCETFSKGGL